MNLSERVKDFTKGNTYHLSNNNNDIELDFEIKDFKLPLNITIEHIDKLLKTNKNDLPPYNMYL